MFKKFVIIKHEENSGKFLFTVPDGICLFAGDKVICDTSRGKDQIGTCCCDSFVAEQEVVCPLFGTYPQNLKPVTGKIVYERFEIANGDAEE